MINEPTHILESSSSCIDLIFTSQPNLVTESGVHLSLHPNSYHQIIFAKFHAEIHDPTPYFGKSGTTKMQILILSDEQLLGLIGTGL